MERFAKLGIKNGQIFLNDEPIRGVEEFKININSDLPKGKAELTLKLT